MGMLDAENANRTTTSYGSGVGSGGYFTNTWSTPSTTSYSSSPSYSSSSNYSPGYNFVDTWSTGSNYGNGVGYYNPNQTWSTSSYSNYNMNSGPFVNTWDNDRFGDSYGSQYGSSWVGTKNNRIDYSDPFWSNDWTASSDRQSGSWNNGGTTGTVGRYDSYGNAGNKGSTGSYNTDIQGAFDKQLKDAQKSGGGGSGATVGGKVTQPANSSGAKASGGADDQVAKPQSYFDGGAFYDSWNQKPTGTIGGNEASANALLSQQSLNGNVDSLGSKPSINDQLYPAMQEVKGGGRDHLDMANVGKTRDKDLQQNLKDVLNYAAEQAGVEVKVESGGQTSERNPLMKNKPGGWTGSTRHNDGGASDIKLIKDGKTLNFNDPKDRPYFEKFAEESAKAGATGIGAGTGYMGPQMMHVGFGTEATWGDKNGTPGWLSSSFKSGRDASSGFDLGAWRDSQASGGSSMQPIMANGEQLMVPIPTARPDNNITTGNSGYDWMSSPTIYGDYSNPIPDLSPRVSGKPMPTYEEALQQSTGGSWGTLPELTYPTQSPIKSPWDNLPELNYPTQSPVKNPWDDVKLPDLKYPSESPIKDPWGSLPELNYPSQSPYIPPRDYGDDKFPGKAKDDLIEKWNDLPVNGPIPQGRPEVEEEMLLSAVRDLGITPNKDGSYNMPIRNAAGGTSYQRVSGDTAMAAISSQVAQYQAPTGVTDKITTGSVSNPKPTTGNNYSDAITKTEEKKKDSGSSNSGANQLLAYAMGKRDDKKTDNFLFPIQQLNLGTNVLNKGGPARQYIARGNTRRA